MQFIRLWLERHFADPQVMGLAIVLLTGFGIVIWLGDMLAPAMAGVVIAYLLEAPVGTIERHRVPRFIAVLVVFALFMAFVLSLLLGVMPLLWRQITALIQQFPSMLGKGQELLLSLPEEYPTLFSEDQIRDLISTIKSEAAAFGQRVLSLSVASVVSVLTVLVYLILLPLMVFFFMKDKRRITNWFSTFLPNKRGLLNKVWREVDVQIGNYVRGKSIEILIVWLVTFVVFKTMDLNFAMLLSVLVGLSVLIPYIGAVVVTVPVALIGFYQWGFTGDFALLVGLYLLIQALDGNVLVPLLFSEVVNLHPVAIIVAVLVFGGLWGFWGVFFAIPLGTLVNAVIRAWPDLKELEEENPPNDSLLVDVPQAVPQADGKV